MKKRYWVISILCSVLSAGFVLLAAWLPTQYQVPVLMYHTIAPSSVEPLNNVQPGHFADQMAYLKKNGYHVLSAADFVEGLKAGRLFDRKSVVITFDDGYKDNYTDAYPVLKRHAFPATVFVEVDHVGRPGHVTWEDVKVMDAGGFTIESHVMTGAYLPSLRREQAVQEIVESKRILELRLGRAVTLLAYPVGGFSEDIKQIVREAGYAAAFATNRGYDRKAKDLYELKRIRIKDSDGPGQLWLKLSGYYNLIRKSKNPF